MKNQQVPYVHPGTIERTSEFSSWVEPSTPNMDPNPNPRGNGCALVAEASVNSCQFNMTKLRSPLTYILHMLISNSNPALPVILFCSPPSFGSPCILAEIFITHDKYHPLQDRSKLATPKTWMVKSQRWLSLRVRCHQIPFFIFIYIYHIE